MFATIPDLLSAAQVAEILALLDRCSFGDGRATAGAAGLHLKHNLQLELPPGPVGDALGRAVLEPLAAHPVVGSAALPRAFRKPLFNRYEPGMAYGAHMDSPAVPDAGKFLRTDVSVTIFLADPALYDGGELMIHHGAGAYQIKMAQGGAVLYPTTCLHEVLPVTRGVRLAAVTWIESLVPNLADRELLADLGAAHDIIARDLPESPARMMILKAHGNLMRRWVQT